MIKSQDIIENIRALGLVPVRVEGHARRDHNDGPLFIGTIEEFLKTTKTLGGKGIFVIVERFDESEFFANDSDDVNAAEYLDSKVHNFKDPVNLTKVHPPMSEYKGHIGEECLVRLSALLDNVKIDYAIEASWWASFISVREAALAIVQKQINDAMKDDDEKQIEREEKLLKLLVNLESDPEFVALTTQKAMKAHALKKYPELEEVDETTLRDKIQILKDSIQARGLNKRGRKA